MRNKKKNKRKLIILIGVFIIALILVITLLLILNQKEEHPNQIMGVYDSTQENIPKLSYKNINALELFGSDTTKQIDIAKNFRRIFENEIPMIFNSTKELSDREISQYYKENEEQLKSNMYEIKEESFIKLCKKMKSMKSSVGTDFTLCDFSKENDSVNVTCTYKNDEKIVLNLSKLKRLTFVE